MSARQRSYIHPSLEKYGPKVIDKPIYKYMRFERLLQLLMDKESFISQVSSWEDTYENWLIKASFYSKTTRVSYREFIKSYYGQCWTTSKETDALWRIYSPDKNSVKIKSTINNLLNAEVLIDDLDKFGKITKYIGQVSYFNNEQITKWLDQAKKETGIINSLIILESQFIKRKEFNHEKEIRLIIGISGDTSSNERSRDHLIQSVDPNCFIDEITFDPRLNTNDFILRSKLIAKLGFKNPIKKSKLYDFRPLTINIVNDNS
jgi:hypothetical protein